MIKDIIKDFVTEINLVTDSQGQFDMLSELRQIYNVLLVQVREVPNTGSAQLSGQLLLQLLSHSSAPDSTLVCVSGDWLSHR